MSSTGRAAVFFSSKASHILLLALAYYLSGRLGLLLAVPPGYATAMWPPSGVALAGILLLGYRPWAGVMIGSFAVNLFTSFDPSNVSSMLISSGIAAVIACGAALQALTGAWLVRRLVVFPNALEQIRDIAWLLLLGGPLSCLIAATIGVATLSAAGAIPLASVPFNWLTWWVGDSIGVLVFTPVILLFGTRTLVSERRKSIVSLTLLMVFALTMVAFFSARNQERERRQIEFDNFAQSVATNIQAQLKQYLVILRDTTAMFDASEHITRQEFERYAAGISSQYPGLVGLSFSEVVPGAERAAYEARIRAEGFTDFSIREYDVAGNLVQAAERAEYLPVTFIAPFRSAVHGFDNLSTTNRREALQHASETGELAATGPAQLVQAPDNVHGALIFSPLFTAAPVPGAVRHLRGFVAAAFYLPKMLETSLDNINTRGIEFVVEDSAAPPTQRLLFESHPGAGGDRNAARGADMLRWDKQLLIAGRNWHVHAFENPVLRVGQQNWTVWFVLAGGLLFTSLFGVFVLIVTAQTDVVRRLVITKTEELRRSEQRFRRVVESASDAIFTIDPAGIVTSWNSAAARIVGYSEAEMIGQHFALMYPPQVEYLPEQVLEQARKQGYYELEDWRVRRDGSMFWASLSVTALYDERSVLFGYSKIERDLTERKQQDEKLAESFRQVSELKSRLALANEAAGIGVWRNDLVTGQKFYDQQLHNLFGYEWSPEREYPNFRARVHPDDQVDFANLIRSKVNLGEECQWQSRIVLPGGDIRYLRAATKGEWDEDGTLLAIVGATWDITDLQLARLAAEQAARAKTEFLANMSHEIRTPLNGILGLTALVLDSPLTGSQRNHLAQVKESGISLLHLLNDILDFSKVEAGKLQLSPIVFNLREILERGLQPLAGHARDKGLKFVLFVSDELPEQILCDPHRLMQIITNLVSNAIKFTAEGGVRVDVQAVPRADRLELQISVSDSGIGIPAAVQSRIFDAFTQADTSTTRRFGGSGLGLSICKQLVGLMGGHIWLESAEGAGSDFHVTIDVEAVPVATEEHPPATVVQGGARVQPLASVRPELALQVLLAEDHPTNQNLAIAVLERRGHRVRLAKNGREAVQWYQREYFDVILMDVQMPEMDGPEATAIIRALEQDGDRHVRIIALTAHVLAGDRERLLAGGMDDYLAKPFFPEQLLAAVESALARKDNQPQPGGDQPHLNGDRSLVELNCFDRKQALARAMNNEELLKKLVITFLANLPLMRDELHTAARDANADALYRAAHKLKGSAATFAAPACAELAKQVEGLARAQNLQGIDVVIGQLDVEIERLMAALRELA